MQNIIKSCIILGVLLSTAPAFAIVNVPQNLNPGVVNKSNTQKYFDDLKPETPKEKQTEKKYELKKKVEEKSLKSPDGKIIYNPKFKLTKVTFYGNTVVSESDLNKFVNDSLNKEIYVKELMKITNKITSYYHSKGYLTSKAYLAPQKIENGEVEITISEGTISNLKVVGNKWAKDGFLKRTFKGNKVEKESVFNVNTIQQSLNDINDNDYIKGKIVVDNSKPNEPDEIILKVKDRFPMNFNASWDNEGQESFGSQRAVLTMSHNNVTGFGDSIYGGTILGKNALGAIAGYSIPLTSKGTKLNFGYSFSDTELGGVYKELGINGYSHDFSVGVMHPLIKKNNLKVISSLSFNINNSKSKMDAASAVLTDHKVRALRAGLGMRKDDNNGIWLANFETSTGIPWFDATEGSEDLGYEDSKFVKVNMGMQRYQRLPMKTMGIFKLNGQYTPNKLLAVEKMRLGGSSSVRGYEPSLLIGDMGFNGSVEFRRDIPGFKAILPERLEFLNDKVKMGVFYDFGLVKDFHGIMPSDYPEFLQSVGTGFHINVTKFLTAHLDVGIPIGRQKFNSQDARLSFSLSAPIHKLWTKNLEEDL